MKNYTLSLLLICLTSIGFTQHTVGLFLNTIDSFDGYTLFAPFGTGTTYLIDNCGEKVHTWESNYVPNASCYLMEDGTLVRTGRQGSSTTIEMIDWDGNLIWSHSIMQSHGRQHHDIEVLPDGNILIIAWDLRTQAEVIQTGGSTQLDTIQSEQIVEIHPDLINGGATVVWEWKVWDHLIQDADNSKDNFGVVADHPELIDINYLDISTDADWLHFNAVAYNADLDQIILGARDMNEIWIIDHSTTIAEAASSTGGNQGHGGDILYRYGNPEAYGQGTAADQKLFLHHHPHWIEDGLTDAGKILVYNNRAGTPTNEDFSEINIIEPPVDANGGYIYAGGAFGPATFDWTYRAATPSNFFSHILSSAQRLPNGNTLICAGASGRFFEIDQNENIVWEYINPVDFAGVLAQGDPVVSNKVFRCIRYAPSYPAFIGKDLTPQGYIETGSTFLCSDFTSVDDIDEVGAELILFPNPANDKLTLKLKNSNQDPLTIRMSTISGQIVYETSTSSNDLNHSIDLNDIKNGIYTITVYNSTKMWTRKVVVSK